MNIHVFNTDCCKKTPKTLLSTHICQLLLGNHENLSHNQLTSTYVAEGQTSHVSDGISKSQSDNLGQRYFFPLLGHGRGARCLFVQYCPPLRIVEAPAASCEAEAQYTEMGKNLEVIWNHHCIVFQI